MALVHRRFAEVLGLVAPLLVAPAIAPRFKSEIERLVAGQNRSVVKWSAAACVGALILATSVAAIGRGATNESTRFAPTQAVKFAKERQIDGRVLNDYEFGGYLIFSGIEPFVDGRADLYGDAFLKRSNDVAQLPDILREYRIAWTLLDVNDPRAALLDHLANWRRIYTDDIAVIHALEGNVRQ
jgi:hypothetical protein